MMLTQFLLAVLLAALCLITTTTADDSLLTDMWYAKMPIYTYNPTKDWNQDEAVRYFSKCAVLGTEPSQYTASTGLNLYLFWMSTPAQMALTDCNKEALKKVVNDVLDISQFAKTRTYNFVDCFDESNRTPVCTSPDSVNECEACNDASYAAHFTAVALAIVAVVGMFF